MQRCDDNIYYNALNSFDHLDDSTILYKQLSQFKHFMTKT